MSSAQRIGKNVVAVAGTAMLVLVTLAVAHDLAAAMAEQHRNHVACTEAHIEAAQRDEHDVRACREGDDVGVHGGEGAVKSGKGA